MTITVTGTRSIPHAIAIDNQCTPFTRSNSPVLAEIIRVPAMRGTGEPDEGQSRRCVSVVVDQRRGLPLTARMSGGSLTMSGGIHGPLQSAANYRPDT